MRLAAYTDDPYVRAGDSVGAVMPFALFLAAMGEHVDYAKQLPGLRAYSIDFVTEGADGGPSAIATLRFDSRQALDAAFSVSHIKENLMRTREQFAESVQVMIVEECIVVPHTLGSVS